MRRHLPLIANVTVGWAVLFAIVHTYWAAGGSAGADAPADSAGAQLYIAFVAMLGLLGAAVARACVRARAHERAAVLLARVGGAALLLGVLVGSLRWIAGNGSPEASGIVITVYFLIGGVLYSTLGRAPTGTAARATHAAR